MNCGGDGTAIVTVLLRFAVRMLTYVQVATEVQRARCMLLATACAQRLLVELRGDPCEWLDAAAREWQQAVAPTANPAEAAAEGRQRELLQVHPPRLLSPKVRRPPPEPLGELAGVLQPGGSRGGVAGRLHLARVCQHPRGVHPR